MSQRFQWRELAQAAQTCEEIEAFDMPCSREHFDFAKCGRMLRQAAQDADTVERLKPKKCLACLERAVRANGRTIIRMADDGSDYCAEHQSEKGTKNG